MHRYFGLVILAFMFSACATVSTGAGGGKTSDQMVKEAKAHIREVTVQEAKRMIDSGEKLVILDVREGPEFATGYMPGAINLPRGMVEFKINTMVPDRTTNILVYCGIDLRGPLATQTLNEMGYRNAFNLIGGLNVWKAAGYPITK